MPSQNHRYQRTEKFELGLLLILVPALVFFVVSLYFYINLKPQNSVENQSENVMLDDSSYESSEELWPTSTVEEIRMIESEIGEPTL